MKVEWVRLGDVLRFERQPIEVNARDTYQRIGIYSWGKGHFLREPVPGFEMGKMRYFTYPQTALIFSNIQAREGAVTLVTRDDTQGVCSSRFYPYVPRTSDVSLAYVHEFFRSNPGLAIMRSASPGTQVRNKLLSRTGIEDASIPLPSRADQDRIAAHLASLEAQILRQPAELSQAEVAHQAAETSWLHRFSHVPLVDLVDVAPAPKRLDPDEKVAFVTMSAVSSRTGKVDGAQYKLRQEVGNGFRQFSHGDILFARITPSMQNGKCAIFDDPQAQVGYGSSEFHVLRPKRAESAEWLHGVLRSHWFRSLAASEFTGTAGQQRVPASFLRSVTVPLPNGPAQVAEATSRLHAFQTSMQNLREVNAERDRLRSAILPAARNEIFSAMQ